MRLRGVVAVVAVLAATCSAETAPPEESTSPAPPARAESTAAPSSTPPETSAIPVDERAGDRARMVEEQIEPRGVSDPLVLDAMRTVPRHRFVGEDWLEYAYNDHPLPIGHGQTISQPYIVATMSESLGVGPGAKVLEIGTGSGYQAAVLAEMGLEVYTIEIIADLADRAATALADSGYDVTARTGDGYLGWEEQAPFDAIIVTAAPDHVPQPLVTQLATGGVMVIPVGPIGAVQTLWRFTKGEDGELLAEALEAVRFVPLTRLEE